jgi:ribosomal protein L17
MSRGGPRPGSGRPKKALAYAAEKAQCDDLLASEAREIMEALVAKAKEGDVSAIRLVIERIWGRAPEGVRAVFTPCGVGRLLEIANAEKIEDVQPTQDLLRAFAMEALGELFNGMKAGDIGAAKDLVSRYMGEPVQTIQQQVAALSPEDAASLMRAHYKAAGLPDEWIERLMGDKSA